MQGACSADTAVSGLQDDPDLRGQRGQVCVQPPDMERQTVQGPGGPPPASPQPLLLEESWTAPGSNVCPTVTPAVEHLRTKVPKKESHFRGSPNEQSKIRATEQDSRFSSQLTVQCNHSISHVAAMCIDCHWASQTLPTQVNLTKSTRNPNKITT